MQRIALGMLLPCFGLAPFAEAAIPRTVPVVGEVVTTQGDEAIRLVEEATWRSVEIRQALATGDALRTGRYGGLAILFRDDTQIRVHANSHLLIKAMAPRGVGGPSRLRLERGSAWSRSRVLPEGFEIETPSATLSIRGTAWALDVDDAGASTVVVLDGEVELANPLGAVRLRPGEIGRAEVGRAPTKTVLVTPRERPQWQLDIGVEWLDLLEPSGIPGFDLLRERRFDEAEQHFAAAAGSQDARVRLEAGLGRFAVHVERQQWEAAEGVLQGLLAAHPDAPEVSLAEIWLRSFRSDLDGAIEAAKAAQRRFADDARFAVLLGHLHLVVDQDEETARAIGDALARDPGQPLAWELQGLYRFLVRGDPAGALESLARGLELAPRRVTLWANRGSVLFALGDYAEAEASLVRAVALDPHFAGPKAALGLVRLARERPDEAEALLRDALTLDAAHPVALQGLGLLALGRGDEDEALGRLLEATTSHPGLANANTQLGIAYYQAKRRREADEALATASRLDPNDPLPELVRSVIAQDHAEAGEAIRHARRSLERYLTWKGLPAEIVAGDRNGLVNVGSAYANLGLADWGSYYAQLSFDPYWANGHFGAGVLYPSAVARRGSDVQGLLLDPLAYARRSRYTDFVRRPFHDPRLSGFVGSRGGAFTDRQSFVLQGFSREPRVLSYALVLDRESDDGFRDDADRTVERAELSAGFDLGASNSLSLGVSGGRTRADLLGPDFLPDANEQERDRAVGVALGFQHRFGPRNRLLARASVDHLRRSVRNPDPFGSRLSPLEASLIESFGLDPTRALFAAGLFQDPTAPPDAPLLTLFPVPGLVPLADTIPDPLDLNRTRLATERREVFELQLRHLFDAGPLEVSYGAEWLTTRGRNRLQSLAPQATGVGTLFLDPFTPVAFPFVRPSPLTDSAEVDPQGISAHLASRWKLHPALWLEAQLFVRHFDDGLDAEETELDPRVGLAWRPAPGHWLRAVAQRELLLPIEGTLAPVATLGLVPGDEGVLAGDRITDLQLRWDAEWSPRVFTFVVLRQQLLEAEAVDPAVRLLAALPERRRLRSATLGANFWILERFGLAASYERLWSQDRGHDVNRHNALALLPEHRFTVGFVWVHPRQIRVRLLERFVGDRPADPANLLELDRFWTTDLLLAWQPLDRHLELQLGFENLFDEDFDLAAGFPASGFTVSAGVEYRF